MVPRLVLVGLFSVASSGCVELNHPDAVNYPWSLPPGFPEPPVPEGNPLTAEKALLGRYLFFDTRLSINNTFACAGCHTQARAFSTPAAHPYGCTGDEHRRNAMALVNVAYNAAYTWANPNLRSLEQQVLGPLYSTHPVELGLADRDAEIVTRLQADGRYPTMFRSAFPADTAPITMLHVEQALASFLRTLISSDSPYDRAQRGDTTAMSPQALRGRDLFFSERLECYHCHSGFNFSDATVRAGQTIIELSFHNTGLYNLDGAGAYPLADQGLQEVTLNPADMGRYRTPTLRNIELTAPYFHDGSAATLEDVLAHYEAGGRHTVSGPTAGDGRTSPLKDGLVSGFTLTPDERQELLAFLRSLTDRSFVTNPAFSNPFIVPAQDSVVPSACPDGDVPTSCPSNPPSYRAEVQGILARRCGSCHVPGGPGSPWPLDTLEHVAQFQTSSSLRVTRCEMPPGEFPQPTLAERRALLTWFACGAPDN